jgi:hypothetical protein
MKTRKKRRKPSIEQILDKHRLKGGCLKISPAEFEFCSVMGALVHLYIQCQIEVPDVKNYKGADWSEVG